MTDSMGEAVEAQHYIRLLEREYSFIIHIFISHRQFSKSTGLRCILEEEKDSERSRGNANVYAPFEHEYLSINHLFFRAY